MTPEIPSPQQLIDTYGQNAPVVVGDGSPMTLGQALAFEEMFCTADVANRHDQPKRVGFLAGILAAGGTLKPEHQYLLLPNRSE